MDKTRYLSSMTLVAILAMIMVACAAPAAPVAPAEQAPAEEQAAVEEAEMEEPVTIEWWTVASEEYSEEAQSGLVAQFEAEHPHIKIDMTILPDSALSEKVTTALGAGEGAPDVTFFWDNNWYPEALDLTPYIEADPDFDPGIYFPGFYNTRAKWGDKVVGLPLGVGANLVMYNKDVFDEAGVPYPSEDWTTDDFTEIATQLTDPDLKRWGGDRPRGPYRAVFFNYGARPYSDDSTTVEGYLNGPESVAAYTWLWDLVNSGSTPTPADIEVLGTEGTGPVDLFLAGRLAMATLNQGHMLNAVNAGANFGIVPEPMQPEKESYVHGWALTSSIWKNTEHPDEAWEFLSYWVGPEGQKYLMENGNLFPSIPSILEQYKDADEEYAQAFFKVLEQEQDAEWLGSHPCYRGAVQRAVGDVWDKIMFSDLERDQIQAELDAVVPAAQQALDDCVPRLGG
ncbi:MAG: sugar ABC transporter substrate-binding protein [Chloroflexi bacterium]|nr:sugar ABC transporter substrate-binding protein [Chloroflexota bacterium]